MTTSPVPTMPDSRETRTDRDDPTGESRTAGSASRRWMICTITFILLWAALLFYVQGQCFCPGYRHGFIAAKVFVRFTLDVLFAAALTGFLPRYLVLVPFSLGTLGGLGLILYSRYFGETMSLLTLFANFGEGTAAVDAMFAMIPLDAVAVLGVGLIAGWMLLFFAGKPIWTPRRRSILALTACCTYFLGIILLNIHPELAFSNMLRDKTTGDLVVVYGFTPVWVGEFRVKDEAALREAALAQPRTDNLTPVETPLPLPRLVVVVQVESLDFSIIDREFNGKIVTPFFNELKRRSFYYKVDPFHRNGSADADFAFLASRAPGRHLLNYKIRTFPYEDALPREFDRRGYQTFSFHNVDGVFFDRLPAFRRMGFRHIVFSGELVQNYGARPGTLGGWNAVDDSDLLSAVSREVNRTSGNGFFFVITLLTHSPFRLVEEKEIFSNPGNNPVHRYANSIHYVDRIFRGFYNSLPPGTLVVVYGDHTSCLETEEYTSRKQGGKEYVPCFLSLVGESIADRQKTADTPLPLSGELTVVDISNYMRFLVNRSAPTPYTLNPINRP